MRSLRLALIFLVAAPLFGFGVFCACAAVLSQFGRIYPGLDVMSHFAPVWLVGSLLVLAMAWGFQIAARRVLLGVGLAGALAATALIAPEFLRDAGPTAPPNAPGQFKLIQFNAWLYNTQIDKTVDWIVRQAPDAVVIEECPPTLRAALLARTGWHVASSDPELMIFSRAAPTQTGLPPQKDYPWLPMSRSTIPAPGGPITILGAHATWPTDHGFQAAQGRYAAGALAQLPRERLILSGDFNSTPWSFERWREDDAFGLTRRTRALFSWPAADMTGGRMAAPFPFLPIDHVYAGPGLATVKVERGPTLGSDHYPVVVIFASVSPGPSARR